MMSLKNVVDKVAEKTGFTKKDTGAVAEAFLETIAEALEAGESVRFVGFGTFEVAERAARSGRNPQTGETLEIPATKAPKFKAGKPLKDRVKA